jgi:hypothetical protein
MRTLYLKLRASSLAGRILLIPVFVGVCHLYDWPWLRALTTITLVKISAALGVPMYRIGADVISVAGVTAQFVVACTMIDAFFGAIPLLWRTKISWQHNFLRLSVELLGVLVLNIVRLEFGFIAMTKGVPWWLAHECVAGVAYFCLFLFIVHERAWQRPGATDSAPVVDPAARLTATCSDAAL